MIKDPEVTTVLYIATSLTTIYLTGVLITYFITKIIDTITIFERRYSGHTRDFCCFKDLYWGWPVYLIALVVRIISKIVIKFGRYINILAEKVAAIYISYKFKKEAKEIKEIMKHPGV